MRALQTGENVHVKILYKVNNEMLISAHNFTSVLTFAPICTFPIANSFPAGCSMASLYTNNTLILPQIERLHITHYPLDITLYYIIDITFVWIVTC